MDTKTVRDIQIKDADRGEVAAVFVTFDAVDSDGDVTRPGAFEDGAVVPISAYGHQSHFGALPVGKATIRQTRTEATLEGQFFMNTQTGRDTFTVVKELGSLGEWSYGYKPTKHSFGDFAGRKVRFLEQVRVLEVSPVLEGAGVNTRTLATKSASEEAAMNQLKTAIRPHSTGVVNRAWDVSAVVSAVADDVSVSELRSMAAWVDPSADPETKSAYSFWHHHGPAGPANVRSAITGIAVLNGARGVDVGAADWSADRDGIHAHLAGHIRDADREPPELRSALAGSMKGIFGGGRLHEEIASALAGVQLASAATDRVVALRAARGKQLSKANAEYLDWLDEDLMVLHCLLRSYIDSPDDEAVREYLRFVQASIGERLP